MYSYFHITLKFWIWVMGERGGLGGRGDFSKFSLILKESMIREDRKIFFGRTAKGGKHHRIAYVSFLVNTQRSYS